MSEKETNLITEEEHIHLKDRQSVTTYLGFLQNVISRMGSNSANIKALIAVVYTIFITIILAISNLRNYWWLGIVISIAGTIMDTYYLAFERMYRTKYNNFVKKLNEGKIEEKDIYNMNQKNTDLKYEQFAIMIDAFKSFSVWGYYVLFIIISMLIYFV